MKSFIAISTAAILSTTATALPNLLSTRQSASEITFALSNGLNGAQVSSTVPVDGSINSFKDLFGSSTLANSDGEILASSMLLTAFPQGSECTITGDQGNFVANLTPQITYVDLDGNPDAAILVDVSGDSISCAY